MSGLLQAFAGILIVFFLPGYTLVCMLFPRRGELDPEYDVVYRVALGMGLSIVIAIFVGFVLNAMSTDEEGYVTAVPLWISLLSLTGIFLAGGWFRGAYPSMGLAHPSLYRPPPPQKAFGMRSAFPGKKREAEKLLIERDDLVRTVEKYAARSSTSNPNKSLYYQRRIDELRVRIEKVNESLDRMDREAK